MSRYSSIYCRVFSPPVVPGVAAALGFMFSYTMSEGCTNNVLNILNGIPPFVFNFYLLIILIAYSKNILFHGNLFKTICARKQPINKV